MGFCCVEMCIPQILTYRDPLGDTGYIKSSTIAKKIFLVIIAVYVGLISSSCDHNFVP